MCERPRDASIAMSRSFPARRSPPARTVEWPTLALTAGIYGSFLAVTFWHAAIPFWLLVPLGAAVVTLHGSLQHEVLHGHPFRDQRVNDLLGLPALWLWLPYRLYRESHLRHHRNDRLTDPLDDPESYYVTGETWRRLPSAMRAILWANQTLLGRLTLGPFLAIFGFWREQVRGMVGGDRRLVRIWAEHMLAVAPVLFWVLAVCRMDLSTYLLVFALPGTSLTMLRSFMEHRPAPEPGARCAIVRAAPFFAFLFLNNNLHAVHHRWPRVPWYRLPELYRRRRAEIERWNGGFVIGGYAAIARSFLLRAKDHPVHPQHP
jgi:fatty acid desaturase